MYNRIIIFFTVGLLIISLSSYSEGKDNILSLEECIELAIEHNTNLRSSELSIRRSSERLNEVRSQYYPSLSMSGSTRRTSNTSEDDDPFFNSYNIGVSTRFNLYQGGRIRGQNQVAEMNILSSELNYEISMKEVIFRLNQAYYGLLQSLYNKEVAKESLRRYELYLEWAKTRLEAGVATVTDVLRAEVEVSDAKLNYITSENAFDNARAVLNNLIGRPSYSEINIIDDLDEIQMISVPEYIELFEIAKNSREELKRIENQLEIQNEIIAMSRADYLPNISLDAGYSYSGRKASDLSDSWNFGFSFNISLFSGGATRSKILQERLAYKELIIQREEIINQMDLVLFQAYNDFIRQADVIDNSIIFLENARENLKIAEGGYREGTHSIIELTDAQNSVTVAENRYIRSLADYRISYANLERILGKNLIELEK